MIIILSDISSTYLIFTNSRLVNPTHCSSGYKNMCYPMVSVFTLC